MQPYPVARSIFLMDLLAFVGTLQTRLYYIQKTIVYNMGIAPRI